MEQLTRIKIDNTDVFLEELGNSKGKITISDTYNHNYSYFWGAMGGTLVDFICSINSGYFADKLMGHHSNYKMDVKKTFSTLRKFIATDLDLPFYKQMKFQKDLREKLKEFQNECEENESKDYFVTFFFSNFINRLSFYEIDDRYERESIEKDFTGISEQWNFIEETVNDECLWLQRFHKKLKAKLLKLKTASPIMDEKCGKGQNIA